VREHLILTKSGRIAFVQQVAGHRHDVQGLYALLETSFSGTLLGDTAYWPRPDKRQELARHGIQVFADTDRRWRFQHTPQVAALIDEYRHRIERWTSLFNQQFHADRTLCRSVKHYVARRWTKALAYDVSRYINAANRWPLESVQHFHLAS
jgi:hypothetical protein